MLERFRGLSRADIYQDLRRKQNDPEYKISPQEALDYFDAFIEESENNTNNTQALRDHHRGLAEDGLSSYDDETNKAIQELLNQRNSRKAGQKILVLEGVDGSSLYGSSGKEQLGAAYESLMNKTNEYRRLNKQLSDAGIPTDGMYGDVNTGVLTGGAPGPYIENPGNNETRHFLDWEDNEITGKPERVPYLDPSNGRPLVQDFGMLDIDGRRVKANEIIQETVLKLAGMNASANNMVKGKEHYSDHIVDLPDGKQKRVEGKIRQSDGYATHTDNIPIEGVVLPNTSLSGRDMSNEVAELIKREMDISGVDMITATENLINNNVLEGYGDAWGKPEQRLGKILRSDPTYMTDPDGIYDQLVVTGYPSTTINPRRNRAGSAGERRARQFKSDKLAVPPESVHLIKYLAAAREYLKSGKGDLLVTPNLGHSQSGTERAFVQGVVPLNAKFRDQPIYTDMATAYPNVQQLLKTLKYKERPQR